MKTSETSLATEANSNEQTPSSSYHTTVLLDEAVDALNPQPGKTYLDATFGGGGHTRALLERHPDICVVAFDWDEEAVKRNAPALKEQFGDRLTVIWGNFAHCYRLLQKNKIKKVDGVLADFGTSQFQIKHEDGFSFSNDTPLDMRMSKAHHYFSAHHIVNKFEPRKLADILFKYGEEPHARRICAAIEKARTEKSIDTTKQLADIIDRVVPKKGYQRTHVATRTFQALRIFVNKELDNIEQFLKACTPFIQPGGRLACISFHSLEDRLVKTFFRENEDKLKRITRKPIIPSESEIERNRASRSAKLRVAEKK